MSRPSEALPPEHDRPLRVLIVEDSEDDALLILDALRQGEYKPEFARVATAAEMRDALKRSAPDLILSDYHLPDFNAIEAFRVYREAGLDVPFLIVSGAIGEETAAAAMKAGAHDYVSKNNLARLVPAVRREMGEAAVRRERAEAEAALRATHSELAAIHANVPVLLLVVEQDLRVHRANEMVLCFSGIKPADTVGRLTGHAIGCIDQLGNPLGCGHGPSCPTCKVRLSVVDTLANGTRHENVEASVPVMWEGKAKVRHLLLTSALLEAERPRKALICVRDVTELKKAQIALEQSQERLIAVNRDLDSKLEQLVKALKEKDVLFRELQHRVKNNLAVISSLLSLQADQTDSGQAREALSESRDRVRSIALVHEQLVWSGQMAEIEFGPYVERLSGCVLDAYGRDRGRIHVTAEGVKAALPLDQAVPCGLILQELISNSLKYAFRGRAEGEIHIELRGSNGQYHLDYRDDGAGFPPGFDAAHIQSLGMQLVSDLAAQLHGTMKCFNDGGARFQLTFPAGTG